MLIDAFVVCAIALIAWDAVKTFRLTFREWSEVNRQISRLTGLP